MLTKITITLKVQERDALLILAEKELRDTREQAAMIIREWLICRGLVDPNNTDKIENRGLVKAEQQSIQNERNSNQGVSNG
jgi:hypothetical protein